MKFGEKLQKLRKQSGLSQEQLAARLTVSRQAVSKWEKGGAPDVELFPPWPTGWGSPSTPSLAGKGAP